MEDLNRKSVNLETATLGGGCFWCTEAIFRRLNGVISVMPGFSGGKKETANYDRIHSGTTGHAESIQIEFDPTLIPFEKILDVFWHTHNPTTLNKQGADEGTEYRSVIFYHDEKQKEIAEKSKKKVEQSRLYKEPIVTEISPFTGFYPADAHHREFYEKNKNSPYCTFVIDPKIQKLLKEFGKDVKEEYK